MYETKTKFSILKKGNHFFLSNYFQEAKRGSTILQESGFLVELGILRGWRAQLPSVGEGLRLPFVDGLAFQCFWTMGRVPQ